MASGSRWRPHGPRLATDSEAAGAQDGGASSSVYSQPIREGLGGRGSTSERPLSTDSVDSNGEGIFSSESAAEKQEWEKVKEDEPDCGSAHCAPSCTL